MKIYPRKTAYFAAVTAIVLLVMMPIFVTMYTLSFLRIRRFVAENPIYQNRGESDANESPEYLFYSLKQLFKTVLLLIAAMLSYLPTIAITLTATVLSFMNHNYLNTFKYLILVHTEYFFICQVNHQRIDNFLSK